MRYDLHSHSYYSDGTLAPADLVTSARAAGLDALALTDHDVTEGLSEAAEEAARVGLRVIPGAEISVTWQRQTIHIVALNIDPKNAALQAGLAGLRAWRNARAEEIGRRLERHGIPDAYAGAVAHARGPIISRTHFARHLVAQQRARDMRHAFQQYLARGKAGHVPSAWAPLEQAVSWTRGAGGVAVIAHPARYKLSSTKLLRLLSEFKECGGEGIEVVSGSHSRDDYFRFATLAAKTGLLASSGSDYHGPETWMQLGRLPALPEGCTPLWPRLCG
jgi:predicted metal-dependent phosphoesterase TrpH